VNLDGLTIKDAENDSHLIDNDGLLLLPPNSYHIYGNNGDKNTNGGITLDYEYSGITLGNDSDEVILRMGDTVIDKVEYNDGDFPDTSGVSMQLDSNTCNSIDNDQGWNWCNSTSTYGDGDKGSPAKQNDTCQ